MSRLAPTPATVDLVMAALAEHATPIHEALVAHGVGEEWVRQEWALVVRDRGTPPKSRGETARRRLARWVALETAQARGYLADRALGRVGSVRDARSCEAVWRASVVPATARTEGPAPRPSTEDPAASLRSRGFGAVH